jgi:predicted nucleic acid-binding Zn ribbon protein
MGFVFNGEVMPVKQCEICGADFNRTANQKTCGQRCSDALRSQRIANLPKVCRKPKYRTCVICGATFRLLTSGSEITCGKECSLERKRQTTNIRQRAKRGTTSHRNCVICGELFEVWGTQKTCGAECGRTLTRQTNRKRNRTRAYATYEKWLEVPENREKVRESKRRYEERKLLLMTEDEKLRRQERAKTLEYERQRRERRKADKAAAAEHRKRCAEFNRRKRLRMTPEDIEEYRQKKREEQRRYRADPVKRQRINNAKHNYRRRRNADAFSGAVMNAMTVLTTILQENAND